MTDLMPMPPLGMTSPNARPTPAPLPEVLAQGGASPQEGALLAVEGMIQSLANIAGELTNIANQFPEASGELLEAFNLVNQAAAKIVGLAQTGSPAPFVPIRG